MIVGNVCYMEMHMNIFGQLYKLWHMATKKNKRIMTPHMTFIYYQLYQLILLTHMLPF